MAHYSISLFQSTLMIGSGMQAALFILLGIGCCFFGYKWIKVVNTANASYIAFLVGIILCALLIQSTWVDLFMGLVLAVGVGLLTYSIPPIGIAISSGLIFYDVFHMFLPHARAMVTLSVVLGIAVLFLTRKQSRFLIILTTAIIGAIEITMAFFSIMSLPSHLPNLILWAISTIIVAAIGFLLQMISTKPKEKKKTAVVEEPVEEPKEDTVVEEEKEEEPKRKKKKEPVSQFDLAMPYSDITELPEESKE